MAIHFREKAIQGADYIKKNPALALSAASLALMAHNTYMSGKDRKSNREYRQQQLDITNALTGQLRNTSRAINNASNSISTASDSIAGVGRTMEGIGSNMSRMNEHLGETNRRLDEFVRSKEQEQKAPRIVKRKTTSRHKHNNDNSEKPERRGFLGRLRGIFS